jgi:hypothetical protein
MRRGPKHHKERMGSREEGAHKEGRQQHVDALLVADAASRQY